MTFRAKDAASSAKPLTSEKVILLKKQKSGAQSSRDKRTHFLKPLDEQRPRDAVDGRGERVILLLTVL